MPRSLNNLATDDLLPFLRDEDDALVGRAVAELISRHRVIAYRSAMRYCRGDRTLADDVFQETFIRLFQWLRTMRDQPPPVTFERLLATFVKRTAIDLMRRETRHVHTAGEEELAAVPMVGSDTEAWETNEDLNRVLSELPERSRRLIELLLQGLTVAQVARALDMSEINVRVSRHRAMALLRARFAADQIDGGRV